MKEKVQVFGRFLSGMVMPNIGAFIAWGFITALFIETGWLPNEELVSLVDPINKYLLPLLIAYTGGKMVGGDRGGVIGTIAAMGIIVATDIPMFLGAMILGPLAGKIIKEFDKLIHGRVKAGFEMLVNNFSIGIIGLILAILAYYGFAPLVTAATSGLARGVEFFVEHSLLPLTALFIEPAKVLFLNNAINHGILSPLGIDQMEELGKSVFFLLESNPGPGLGVLLAYCVAGKGTAKSSAPGAVIIHFFGGIHEIYFPYILMNPSLLLAVIAGGASGTLAFVLADAALVSPASPGSIIALIALAPKGGIVQVLIGVAVAAVVSFVVALPLVRIFGKEDGLEQALEKKNEMKAKAKGLAVEKSADTTENTEINNADIKTIVFACDAGMGSSAMGATVLRKKLKAANRGDITVVHASVSNIPSDAQIVVTHEALQERARNSAPQARLVLITNFMAAPQYDELAKELAK